MKSFFLSTALFMALADAVAFRGPKPTPADEVTASLGQGWTPRPTYKSEVFIDLRRQAATTSGSQIGWQAPDNTCGYLDGSLGEFTIFMIWCSLEDET